MDPKQEITEPPDPLEEISPDETSSVDDFIRELEAKEKDLHITSDLRIEIEDDEFDNVEQPVSIAAELPIRPSERIPEPPDTLSSRNSDYADEIAILKLRINELKGERKDMQEKSDRRIKDFESFKYRVDRERRGAFIDQIGNLASQMLPVLDNLDRALDSADLVVADRSPEFKQFFDGIILVNQQLNEVFAGMGVEPIIAAGTPFDPNFHEAVATETSEDTEPNIVLEEMLRGYRIGNRVIRHSMVKVNIMPNTAAVPTHADDDYSSRAHELNSTPEDE